MIPVAAIRAFIRRSGFGFRFSVFKVQGSRFKVQGSKFEVRFSVFGFRFSTFDVRRLPFDVRCSVASAWPPSAHHRSRPRESALISARGSQSAPQRGSLSPCHPTSTDLPLGISFRKPLQIVFDCYESTIARENNYELLNQRERRVLL